MRWTLLLLLSCLSCEAQKYTPLYIPNLPPSLKTVAIADSATHLWMFDTPTTYLDYVGSENLTKPVGISSGQPPLLVGATNTSLTVTTTTSTAHMPLSTGTIWDYTVSSNWSFEWVTQPNLTRSGSAPISGGTENTPVVCKVSTDGSYVGWEVGYSQSDALTINNQWMTVNIYMSSDGSHIYRASAECETSNGIPHHVVATYTNVAGVPTCQAYVDGNRLNMYHYRLSVPGTINSSARPANLFGANNGTAFNNYVGGCGFLASYHYCLSPEQVQNHFLAARGYRYNTNSSIYSSFQIIDTNGARWPLMFGAPVLSGGLWYVFGAIYTNLDYITSLSGTPYDQAVTNVYGSSSPSLLPGTWSTPVLVQNGSILPNCNFGSVTRASYGFNPNTSKHTLISHAGCGSAGNQYASNSLLIAESTTTILGNYTRVANILPQGVTTPGDCFLYVDGSTGYVLYCKNGGGGSGGVYVSALASDFHSTTGSEATIGVGSFEGPSVTKIGNLYVATGSTVQFYDMRQMLAANYFTATNMLGPWTNQGSFYADAFPTNTGYANQSAGLWTNALGNAYYSGNRWAQTNLSNSFEVIAQVVSDGGAKFHLATNLNILYGPKAITP